MININFMGKYEVEEQLIRDDILPTGATQFRESNSIAGAFLGGFIISLPLMIPMTVILILNLKNIIVELNVNPSFFVSICLAVLLLSLFTYIHEFIHVLLFPKDAQKEIWTAYNQGALFVYCTARVSKLRFIVISTLPALILGILPFGIWMMIYESLSVEISILFGIISWFMPLTCIGDFYNAYNTIIQVPKDAKVFNHGFHTFWIK